MKNFKKEAREYLTRGENYMKMTFGLLLCIASFIVPLVIIQLFMVISDYAGADEAAVNTVGGIFIIVVAVCVSFPTVLGYFRMGTALASGKEVPLSGMFSVFGKVKKYFASLAFAVSIILICMIPPAVFSVLEAATREFLDLADLAVLYGFIKFVSVAALYFVLFAALSRFFLVPYYLNGGAKFMAAAKQSIKATRAKPLILFNFFLSYIPLILLSVASVFTFFIVYTIPVMVGSYAAAAKHFDKKERQTYE